MKALKFALISLFILFPCLVHAQPREVIDAYNMQSAPSYPNKRLI